MHLEFVRVRKGTALADGAHFTYRVSNTPTGWFVWVFDAGALDHVEGPFARRFESEAFAEEWEALGTGYDTADHDGLYREAVAYRRAMQRLYPQSPKAHARPIRKDEWTIAKQRERAQNGQ